MNRQEVAAYLGTRECMMTTNSANLTKNATML